MVLAMPHYGRAGGVMVGKTPALQRGNPKLTQTVYVQSAA